MKKFIFFSLPHFHLLLFSFLSFSLSLALSAHEGRLSRRTRGGSGQHPPGLARTPAGRRRRPGPSRATVRVPWCGHRSGTDPDASECAQARSCVSARNEMEGDQWTGGETKKKKNQAASGLIGHTSRTRTITSVLSSAGTMCCVSRRSHRAHGRRFIKASAYNAATSGSSGNCAWTELMACA